MGKRLDSKVIEEYQKILAADPRSKVFAVLADAYREMGLIDQGESIARRGVAQHFNYAPGYVSLGRILLTKNKNSEAIPLLQKAIELSPDNVLAHQLLGETHLKMQNPKEALKAHKMALFLNPQNPRSQQVVKKLEALTADEFDEDIFAMKALPEVVGQETLKATKSKTKNSSDQNPKSEESPSKIQGGLERALSVVDALLVRSQTDLARERLLKLNAEYRGHAQIQSRWQLLGTEDDLETPTHLAPLPTRERQALDEKIRKLKAVLQAIENRRHFVPETT